MDSNPRSATNWFCDLSWSLTHSGLFPHLEMDAQNYMITKVPVIKNLCFFETSFPPNPAILS